MPPLPNSLQIKIAISVFGGGGGLVVSITSTLHQNLRLHGPVDCYSYSLLITRTVPPKQLMIKAAHIAPSWGVGGVILGAGAVNGQRVLLNFS